MHNVEEVTMALLVARIGQALAEAEAISALPHTGLRGRFREILVGNLLKPLLPPTCSILHGTTVDPNGRRFIPSVVRERSASSGFPDDGGGGGEAEVRVDKLKTEDDILIVDEDILPPFFRGEGEGIVPLDAVVGRIEAKSRLTTPELRDAILGATQFRRLRFSKATKHTLQAIFAFKSDLKEKSEYRRLIECLSAMKGSGEPPVHSLCVPRAGYWFFGSVPGRANGWHHVPPTTDFREVRYFLAFLMNSLPEVRESRKFARLGDYTASLDGIEDPV